MTSDIAAVQISLNEEELPRFDPSHGTPDPMVRRLTVIHLPRGSATFEQTDYGHPGRFNPWDARGIDPPLQPRAEELRALCEAIGRLLS